jgi:hypothetical protein
MSIFLIKHRSTYNRYGSVYVEEEIVGYLPTKEEAKQYCISHSKMWESPEEVEIGGMYSYGELIYEELKEVPEDPFKGTIWENYIKQDERK